MLSGCGRELLCRCKGSPKAWHPNPKVIISPRGPVDAICQGWLVMLFCSEEFLIFFVVVFAIYWATPWHRLRTYLLLLSSFYFYYSWSATLACIVVVSSLVNFALARWLEETPSRQRKRLCLWLSVGA